MIKAVRGAYSLEVDSKEEIEKKTLEFLDTFFYINKIKKNKIVNILISSTNDIKSDYPCKYFRKYGLDFSLMCLQEQFVENSEPLIIRVFFLIKTFRKLKPVYINRAKKLRKF